ncbi:MAG: hypothetical protein KJ971_08060 [Firmicutes bacterium]|nr:hypothetical protein [Bacillota bacterium]
MKKNTESLFSFIITFIGIAVAVMIFFPALSFQNSDSSFLGYEVVFGTEFFYLDSLQIVWSFWGVLAYLLPLIASLVMLYFKKSSIISLLLFTVGAVLLFTLPLYTTTTVTILSIVTEIEFDWILSYGLIIAGILSSMGAFLCLYRLTYKK